MTSSETFSRYGITVQSNSDDRIIDKDLHQEFLKTRGDIMAKLKLTIAFDKYDYLQPLRDGEVQAEGIDLNVITVESGIRHERMFHYGEYDACEFSMSSYLVARGQRRRLAASDSLFPAPHVGSQVLFHQGRLRHQETIRSERRAHRPAQL